MHEFDFILNNTETACNLCEREFTHDEIINIIHSDNDIEKQICILKLQGVNSQAEADLLVFNLTNHHGIIRESVAIKLNELMCVSRVWRLEEADECQRRRAKPVDGDVRVLEQNSTGANFCQFFQTEKILNTLLDAIIDINPNICRLVIESLAGINDKKSFFGKLYNRVVEEINDALAMNIRNKGYAYSRKVFKIFWYMEAVSELGYFEDEAKIQELLLKTYKFKDYTIREKSAKLAALVLGKYEITDIVNTLKNDENYFVRFRFIQN